MSIDSRLFLERELNSQLCSHNDTTEKSIISFKQSTGTGVSPAPELCLK